MKIVYIVGPYRSKKGINGIVNNIMNAEKVAIKYWKLGYAVICPHMNTALMDGIGTDDMFLAGDREIIKRVDIIVVMKKWKTSKGSIAEIELAKKLNKDIIYD